MSQLNSHQRGLLMTIFGVLVLTPDALMLRLIEADLWTTLFWRSLFMTASLFAINAWIEQRNPLYALRDLFKDGLFCTLLFTGSNICFVISITTQWLRIPLLFWPQCLLWRQLWRSF